MSLDSPEASLQVAPFLGVLVGGPDQDYASTVMKARRSAWSTSRSRGVIDRVAL